MLYSTSYLLTFISASALQLTLISLPFLIALKLISVSGSVNGVPTGMVYAATLLKFPVLSYAA